MTGTLQDYIQLNPFLQSFQSFPVHGVTVGPGSLEKYAEDDISVFLSGRDDFREYTAVQNELHEHLDR